MTMHTKKCPAYFLEIDWFSKWPGMFGALELGYNNHKGMRTFTFGITLFYYVLFFIEYTRFNAKTVDPSTEEE